jgi:hypothetical protein
VEPPAPAVFNEPAVPEFAFSDDPMLDVVAIVIEDKPDVTVRVLTLEYPPPPPPPPGNEAFEFPPLPPFPHASAFAPDVQDGKGLPDVPIEKFVRPVNPPTIQIWSGSEPV